MLEGGRLACYDARSSVAVGFRSQLMLQPQLTWQIGRLASNNCCPVTLSKASYTSYARLR